MHLLRVLIKTLVLLLLGLALPAFSALEIEPNNSRGIAQSLGLGEEVEGTLSSSGDSDWFALSVTNPGVLTVSFRTEKENDPRRAGFGITLYSDMRSGISYTLAYENCYRECVNYSKVLSVAVNKSGTYWLEIDSPIGHPSGYYLVSATLGGEISGLELEPNNSDGTAQSISFDTKMRGKISGRRDEDWFALAVGGEGELRVSFETEKPNEPRKAGFGIALYSNVRSGIIFELATANCWEECVGYKKVLKAAVNQSGTYYLVVKSNRPTEGRPSGFYDFTASFTGEIPSSNNEDNLTSSGFIYLQTTSTSNNISVTHILNTAATGQEFRGTLWASDGSQVGLADQSLHAGQIAPEGRLVVSSKDLESAFNIDPWQGPALLEVKGGGAFDLMTKLTSPSGLTSSTNCVRQERVQNIGGFDQTDVTYVRFINIGDTPITNIKGSLYDSAGNVIGSTNPVLIDELPAKAHVWKNRNQLSDLAGDTWNGTASLKIDNADSNLRLLNLNFINNETFFNFSCYESGQ